MCSFCSPYKASPKLHLGLYVPPALSEPVRERRSSSSPCAAVSSSTGQICSKVAWPFRVDHRGPAGPSRDPVHAGAHGQLADAHERPGSARRTGRSAPTRSGDAQRVTTQGTSTAYPAGRLLISRRSPLSRDPPQRAVAMLWITAARTYRSAQRQLLRQQRGPGAYSSRFSRMIRR